MALEDVDCFKYYEFQTGLIFDDLMTEKVSYSPGDDVDVSYNLFSQMESPIVEGSVRVQIFYNDPVRGEQMIDEFFTGRDINLRHKDVVGKKFTWTVPKGAKAGEYTIKTYFVVGGFFNLAGLSMLPYGPPGVPGDMTSFTVGSSTTSRIYFSKGDTYVNNKKYEFGAPVGVLESKPLTIKTKLINEGPAKQVNIKLRIYGWDDLTEEPLDQHTVEKTISLEANGAGDITYELPTLASATYEIKFIAESSEEKSILKLRIPISGANGRFIYAGIDKFPLTKDQETTLFICYSNSADYSSVFNGKGTLEILDEEGNSVFKENYGPFEVLATPPQGKKVSFKPTKNLNYIVLKADMYDDKGNLHDQVSLVYDYSRFANVPANIGVELSGDRINSGESISYTVSYNDDLGMPLKGKFLVYLIDPDGKIIHTVSDKDISGSFKGDIGVSGKSGQYKLTVRELTHDLKAEGSFTVGGEVIATTTLPKTATTTPPDEEQEGTNYWLVGLILIIVIIAILWMSKTKK